MLLSNMNRISLEIISSQDFLNLFDKRFDHILIHKFTPNQVLEWWETDLRLNKEKRLDKIKVRRMEIDVQTNLQGLREIYSLQSVYQLRIYQFDRRIPNTLLLENFSGKNWEQILKQNGLQHCFLLNCEFATVQSFDLEFIKSIESDPQYRKRIIKKEV